MSFDDCVEKGLLRKSSDAVGRVIQSVSMGDRFLRSAEKNYDIEEFEVSEMVAYTALFHYARALLFAKGYVERSHTCLFDALRRFYPGIDGLISRADRLRVERHNLQYSGLITNSQSARISIDLAREFGTAVKKELSAEG